MKKSFFYLLFIVLNILSFSKEKDNLVIGVIYDNFSRLIYTIKR